MRFVYSLLLSMLWCGMAWADLPSGFLGGDGILTREEVLDGWIALFDGETMFGWRPQENANFRIEDRAIVVDEGDQCLLCTSTQFSDYVLKLEFRSDPDTNSGIFLRTPPKPTDVNRSCYELNIAPQDNPFPTGSFVQRKKVEGQGGDDAWHAYEVTMDAGHIVVKLDGEQIMEYVDETPVGRGFIGLQHNKGRVEFRNIKLKPLAIQPIFNGQNLDGWKTYPEMPGKFSATTDQTLKLTGGKGQLESAGSYGDFVLQVEFITHGPSVNSGIFFRSIPGQEMMGYESQIQNGSPNPKELMPRTGSIVRRQLARSLVSGDFEWTAKTIIAEGPHMAVWVNGYLVSDWIDRRKTDANPRRGLRTDPGTIILQGHDAATEITFRDIHIGEMKSRW